MHKPFKVWTVNQGDDDRHCGYPKWYFPTYAQAQEVAKGRGWYGGDAPIGEGWAITIELDNETYLLQHEGSAEPTPIVIGLTPTEEVEIWNKALSKLTLEEQLMFNLQRRKA
jgi:hypothetical protein